MNLPNTEEVLEAVNWTLLREQKRWLLEQDNSFADGVICLIDELQDALVLDGLCTETEVFGLDAVYVV